MVLHRSFSGEFQRLAEEESARSSKDAQAQIAKAPEGVRAEDAATDASYAEARVAKVPPGIPVNFSAPLKMKHAGRCAESLDRKTLKNGSRQCRVLSTSLWKRLDTSFRRNSQNW